MLLSVLLMTQQAQDTLEDMVLYLLAPVFVYVELVMSQVKIQLVLV